MPSFASEQITIAVATKEHRCKVFKVSFSRRDGSLFVSFPYYRDAYGLLCHATLRAGTAYPAQVNLTEGGKFTSHKVKYSHHPDGNVLFSQDGKIYSKIRKRSVSLDAASGHLFSIQLQGLNDFEAIPPTEMQSAVAARRTRINFQFPGDVPEAIKFVGHWHCEKDLLARMHGDQPGPWYVLQRADGSRVHGAIIRDPFLSRVENCYLLLSCEPISRLDKDQYSALTFVGGFDTPEFALNRDLDTTFLALSYPTSSYETLASSIGSVDYVRETNQPDP